MKLSEVNLQKYIYVCIYICVCMCVCVHIYIYIRKNDKNWTKKYLLKFWFAISVSLFSVFSTTLAVLIGYKQEKF